MKENQIASTKSNTQMIVIKIISFTEDFYRLKYQNCFCNIIKRTKDYDNRFLPYLITLTVKKIININSTTILGNLQIHKSCI